nr:hypothetical protein [Tanacetum cinerariifolium]
MLVVKEEEVTKTVFNNRSSDEENSLANDRFMKGKGYHAVPPPLTGNYMPPKSDLSFAGLDDSIYKFKISETVTSLTNDEKDTLKTSTTFVEKTKEVRTKFALLVKIILSQRCINVSQRHTNISQQSCDSYARMVPAAAKVKKHVVPTPVLTQSKLVPITAVRLVYTVVPKPTVTRPRQAKPVVTKPTSPPRRHINHRPSPKASTFPLKVTAVRAPLVNAVKGVQKNKNGSLNVQS